MPKRKRTNRNLPPNLYLDMKKGRPYFVYRDPLTGVRHGFGSDRSQAIRAALELNAKRIPESTLELVARVEGTNKTTDAWLDQYWNICENERELKPNTMRTRKSIVAGLRKQFGNIRLDQVTTKMVADYLQAMRNAGKARSAQAYRSTLKDVFNTAIAEGWVTSNPVAVTRAPKVTVKRSRLKLDEFHAVLRAAEQHREPWVANAMLLALVTAQRVEDIANMQFDHVKDGWLQVEQAKTGNRVRIGLNVRLDALNLTVGDVVSRCRDQVLSRRLVHHTRSHRGAPSGSPVHQNTISRGFKEARDRSGLTWKGEPATFHEIRSLAGRLYKDQGLDPQGILGHKDARTTAIYTDSRGAEWVEVKG